MPKKRFGMFRFGICQDTGEEDLPISYYPDTGEYLIDASIRDRKIEVSGNRKVEDEERLTDFFTEITALSQED